MTRVRQPDANVFAVPESDASVGAPSALVDGVNGATVYGIFPESIAALHCAIGGRGFHRDEIDLRLLAGHKEVFVYDEMHGGWLMRFPDDFVDALADLSPADIGTIARRWEPIFAECLPRPTPAEVDQALQQMVVIAQSAKRPHRKMYWLIEDC